MKILLESVGMPVQMILDLFNDVSIMSVMTPWSDRDCVDFQQQPFLRNKMFSYVND